MESLSQVYSTNNAKSVTTPLKSYNIVDVVSKVVALEKRGDKYIGQCPFHIEKMYPGDAMSLQVDPEEQTFHCYKCGVSGDYKVFARLLGY